MKIYIYIMVSVLLFAGCSSSDKGKTETQDELYSRIIRMGPDYKMDSSEVNNLVVTKVIEGTKLYEQGKYAESVIEYQDAMLYDSSYSLYYALSKSYIKLRKYNLARNNLKKCLDLNPYFIPAYETLTEMLIYTNNFEEAKEVIKKIIELDPSPSNKFTLARFYEFQGKNKKAIEIYDEILENNPGNKNALVRLYNIYGDSEPDKAVEILKELLKVEPNNKNYINDLVSIYQNNREYEKALELLDRLEVLVNTDEIIRSYIIFGNTVIEDTSKSSEKASEKILDRLDARFFTNWRIQLLKGHLNAKLERYDQADKNFSTTLNLNDSLYTLPFQIGNLFQFNNKYDLAIKYYERSLELNQDFEDAEYMLSYAYLSENKTDSALKYAKNLVQRDTTSVIYLAHLGMVLQESDSLERSEEIYKKAYDIAPQNPLLNNNYAYLLSVMNRDLDKAIKMSKIALEEDPGNGAYLDTYGWILYQQGKYEEALKYIKDASEKDDAGGEVFEHLGDIYIKLEMFDKAVKAYEKALEQDPKNKKLKNKIEKYING